MIGAILACAPEPAGTLVFVAETDGVAAVWRVGVDGSNPRELHAGAFPADQLGGELYVKTGESLWLGEVLLAGPAGRVRTPAWSPDGAWITLEIDSDLYRVARDGSGLTRLTAAPNGSFEPAVSATRLAFGTSRDGNAEIYVADVDGQHPRRVTDHPADDVRPRWRPGTEELWWISSRSGSSRVWSETGPLRAEGAGDDLDFTWSPDGSAVAVTVQAGRDVWVEIVGESVVRLDGPGIDEHPAWSPDGAWIAWSSDRDGDRDLYVSRPDGSAIRHVLARPGPDWLPRWRHD